MRVLIACEFSGRVREAFTKKGHEAFSCDILPSKIRGGKHFQGDILEVLGYDWDMMIAFPPCTYHTVTGNKWFGHPRFPDRYKQRDEAREFFMNIANAPIDKIAIENPVGTLSTWYRKPDQYIQPYEYGEPQSKKTCLWLKNLKPLQPTKIVEPQWYTYKDGRRDPLWHYETMKLPAEERSKQRSVTFQGIADAMANQWGSTFPKEIIE